MDKKKLIGLVVAAVVLVAGALLGIDIKSMVCSAPVAEIAK